MAFADTTWLALLPIALAAFAALQAWSEFRRRSGLRRLLGTRLAPILSSSRSGRLESLRALLLLAALGLGLTALARPQWGERFEPVSGKGIDILIAFDVSRSMLAEDIRPNRLERSKLAALDLVSRLEGDRVGLIAFSGTAFLQAPLTLDYFAFQQTLETLEPGVLPQGGTDLAAAIAEAQAAYEEGDQERILILVTDGEDLAGEGLQQAREAAADGLVIHTVGVGSPEGELIPVRDESGRTDYLRDQAGNVVQTRLDEPSLRAVAEATGGTYRQLGATGGALIEIYETELSQFTPEEREGSMRRLPVERYQLPLAIAVGLLVLEPLLGSRRRIARSTLSASPARPERSTTPQKAAVTLILLTALASGFLPPNLKAQSPPPPGDASTRDRPGTLPGDPTPTHPSGATDESAAAAVPADPRLGVERYRAGAFQEAHEIFRAASRERPTDRQLLYNAANAAFRDGRYAEAAEAYRQALDGARPDLQADTFHNLGNTLFRQGQERLRDSQPEETLQLWEESLAQYDSALELDPAKEASRENRAKVAEKIRILRDWLESQKPPESPRQPDPSQEQEPQSEQQQQQSESEQQQQSGDDSRDRSSQGNNQGQDQTEPGEEQPQTGEDQPRESGQEQPQPQSGQSGSDDGQPQSPQSEAPEPSSSGRPGADQEKQSRSQSAEGPDDFQPGGQPEQPEGNSASPEDAPDREQSQEPRDSSAPGMGQEEQEIPERGDSSPEQSSAEPGQPETAGAAAGPGQAADGEPRRMSREEARRLLDGLRSGEKKLSGAQLYRLRDYRDSDSKDGDW